MNARAVAWIAVGIVAVVLLSGCTMGQRAFINESIVKIRAAKDTEAQSVAAALCAMSIGARNRNFTDAEIAAIDVLCP